MDFIALIIAYIIIGIGTSHIIRTYNVITDKVPPWMFFLIILFWWFILIVSGVAVIMDSFRKLFLWFMGNN
jgi:hypothetical protein